MREGKWRDGGMEGREGGGEKKRRGERNGEITKTEGREERKRRREALFPRMSLLYFKHSRHLTSVC